MDYIIFAVVFICTHANFITRIMKIYSFSIEGFANIEHVRLEMEDMSALVAPNGYGKSNILHAIDFGIGFLTADEATCKQMMDNRWQPINVSTKGKDFAFAIEGTIDIDGNYGTDDPEEEALCPFNRNGCILGADDKPFDCSIWPLRVMRYNGGLAICLTPTCPVISQKPLEVMRELVNGETGGIRFRSEESEIMATQLAFTEAQADAILDMRLYKLIGLELEALIKEHDETVANIYRYEDILEERDSMTKVLRADLARIRDRYAQPRKTEITQAEAVSFVVREDEEDRELLFVMDRFGYAKTMDPAVYSRNQESVESGYKYYFMCRSTGKICLFTDNGTLHTVKVSDLPLGKLRDKGIPIDNIGNYDSSKEEIVMACSQTDLNLYKLLFVTKKGLVKTVSGGEFETRMKTMNATKLGEGDSLVFAGVITDQKYAVLMTANGYLLKFLIEQIPEMKKAAAGVAGIKLSKEDYVERAVLAKDKEPAPLVHRDTEIDLDKVRAGARNGRGSKRF